MHNRFRPYNKSMLVNVLMSNEYKRIENKSIFAVIPKYDDINQSNYGRTVLMHACCNNGMINIIRLLLSHPEIDVNAQSKVKKNTALMFVCDNLVKRYSSVLKLLLQHPNIDVNIINNENKTALDYTIDNLKYNLDRDNILDWISEYRIGIIKKLKS